MAVLTFIFNDWDFYVETIGFLALSIEATLGMPQAYSNWKNASTKGLSVALVVNWFLGDASKTGFFVFKDQPMQFILCGIV
mmetsp:Transcript_36021/g.32400  ORF Transcript_36021/g.32400 Transcript_36021/m.32400 type:complete len:81 (-) Transcript_36021:326-568(-)